MANLLIYLTCAAAFIAVVCGVEALWYLVRGRIGEGRAVSIRLARARAAADPQTKSAAPPDDPLTRFLDQRIPWLRATLERSRSRISPLQVVLASVVLLLSLYLLLKTIGVPPLLALAPAVLISVAGPPIVLNGLVARRRKRFLDQLPHAVDLIARGLQAGHPVSSAISVVAKQMADPIGSEFALVIQEMTYGLDRDAALQNLIERFPLPELRMFVASLEVTRESGGNLAEVFLKLAEAIRAKAQLRKKVEAISAEGRLSFWVVSALPIVVGGALLLIRPGFYTEVAGDPLFWPMMAFAPLMLTIGAAIIWRMVNVKI
jgi:tight adherence protein B